MASPVELIVVAAILIPGAVLFWYVFSTLRRITKNNRNVRESAELWNGKDYRCPACQTLMEQGYSLAGKGIIWTPRFGRKIGAFAHIGQVLDNTLSLRIPPALNMTWQCVHCSYVLINHSKLVTKVKFDR